MYVNIAVLKETQPHERRVALVPSMVAKLTKLGAKPHMQTGAADAIRGSESAHGKVIFMDNRSAMVADADVVLCVQPPGEWIAISGCGGLGHLAIKYAKVMGLHVCAVDIDDGKLDHVTRLGADMVINARTQNPGEVLKKAIGGGAHGVLITAPSLPAFKQGIEMTRKRGTCALVGLLPGEFPTPLFDVVANCITIRGSFVGTRKDMAERLQFAAEGKVKADIELQPLASINTIFERLENGDVPSRVVLDFTNTKNDRIADAVKEAKLAVPVGA